MLGNFTEQARKSMNLAVREAQMMGNEKVSPEHILLGLICAEEGVAHSFLKKQGCAYSGLKAIVAEKVQTGPEIVSTAGLPLSKSAKNILKKTEECASIFGSKLVDTEHILHTLAQVEGVAYQVLKESGFKVRKLEEEMDIKAYQSVKFNPPGNVHHWYVPKSEFNLTEYLKLLYTLEVASSGGIEYFVEVKRPKGKRGEAICRIPIINLRGASRTRIANLEEGNLGTPVIAYNSRNLGQIADALDLRSLFVSGAQAYEEKPLATTIARRIRGRSKNADSLADKLLHPYK